MVFRVIVNLIVDCEMYNSNENAVPLLCSFFVCV